MELRFLSAQMPAAFLQSSTLSFAYALASLAAFIAPSRSAPSSTRLHSMASLPASLESELAALYWLSMTRSLSIFSNNSASHSGSRLVIATYAASSFASSVPASLTFLMAVGRFSGIAAFSRCLLERSSLSSSKRCLSAETKNATICWRLSTAFAANVSRYSSSSSKSRWASCRSFLSLVARLHKLVRQSAVTVLSANGKTSSSISIMIFRTFLRKAGPPAAASSTGAITWATGI